MHRILTVWKNISITKKIYIVVGIMALLIAGQLLTMQFAMRSLSAARAFVGGEALWSKAQKNAIFSLQRFGITKNEKDYQDFLGYFKIPEGDQRARIELQKSQPDLNVVHQGFLDGEIHPSDIPKLVEILRRFYWVPDVAEAIQTWTQGDELLAQLKTLGNDYHRAVLNSDQAESLRIQDDVVVVNQELNVLEARFSFLLGQASRWLEYMVLSILTITVLLVAGIGLWLTTTTTTFLSRGFDQLTQAATRIGQGDFRQTLKIESSDEIGKLASAVNSMGETLQKSYAELESRVKERTLELAKLANENSKLYEEASKSVKNRDEFLSIASHELRTPLTSLYLQLQMISRFLQKVPRSEETNKIETMIESTTRQTRRISSLLDELLDLTKIRIGKLELHRERCDLSSIVSDVVFQLKDEAFTAGTEVSFVEEGPALGDFDSTRMRQVVTNLLSNAIKFGNHKPVELRVSAQEQGVVLSVRDSGVGIPADQQNRIFERFERGPADSNISGLGLGLYISRQIILAHKGSISVESVEGQGSTFTVRI